MGLAFLEENGLIYSETSDNVSRPKSVAKFLKSCAWLDKRLLGDFVSHPENTEVLREFIGLFDFRDVCDQKLDIIRVHSDFGS